MSFNWNEHKQTGDWVTFENPGDSIVGSVTAIRVGKDFNGNPVPELVLVTDDGDEKTLTAGQVMLKSALAEQAPQVGDKIRVVYTGDGDARPGKRAPKLFDVAVRTGAGNTDPTQTPAKAAPAAAAQDAPF